MQLVASEALIESWELDSSEILTGQKKKKESWLCLTLQKRGGGGLPLPAPGFYAYVLGMKQIMGINAIHGSLF